MRLGEDDNSESDDFLKSWCGYQGAQTPGLSFSEAVGVGTQTVNFLSQVIRG